MTGVLAFLRRDYLAWSSYRTPAAAQAFGMVIVLSIVYFMAHAVSSDPTRFGGQATDFFSFVLAGLCFSDVFIQSFLALQESIRESQLQGTLEPLLLTKPRLSTLVLGSTAFRILMSCVRCAIYVVLGVTVFGYWHHANIPVAALVFVLTCIACGLFGMLAAAFVVTVKRGEPAVAVFMGSNAILGGAIFPTSLLPLWLQPVVSVLPFTPGLAGIRLALQGAATASVVPELVVLLCMNVLLLPIAVVALNWSMNRARREGSLVQY